MAHNKRDAKNAITASIAHLNKAISSSDTTLQKVVTGCEGKKLITPESKNSLLSSLTGRDTLQRAGKLTGQIQTVVELKPALIDTFLCVLVDVDDIACTAVAEDIAAKYGLYRLESYTKCIAGTCTIDNVPVAGSNTIATGTIDCTVITQDTHERSVPENVVTDFFGSDPVYTYHTKGKGKGERGVAFIINNVNFGNGKDRESSIEDAKKLRSTFERLDYRTITRHDLSSVAMKDELSKIANEAVKEDHDSFVCCILSHGNERGIEGIGGRDDVISVPELTEIINCKNCPKLFGKPKIFFIQACRGDNTPDPVVLDNTTIYTGDTQVADGRRRALPPEADFMISFCTSQDNVACRGLNTGAQYIIKLCETIDKYSSKLNLYELLLVVHREIVALEFKVTIGQSDKVYHQMPELRSTLQGKFKFEK